MHLPTFPPPGFLLHESQKPTANLKPRPLLILKGYLIALLVNMLIVASLESQEKVSLPTASSRLAIDTIALTSTFLNINNI